jgi:DNA-binding protein H-NS
MAINLEKLSLDELKNLKKDVELAIRGFEKRRKKEALVAAQKAAQEHGFSLDEILGEKSGSKGMPKYANPANPGPDLDRSWPAARLGERGARQGQEPRRSRDLRR